jgi:hypothetical protein
LKVSSKLDSYAWISSGCHHRDELDEGLGSSDRYRESGTYPEGSLGRGYFSGTIAQKNRPCECDMCYGSYSDSSDSGRV